MNRDRAPRRAPTVSANGSLLDVEPAFAHRLVRLVCQVNSQDVGPARADTAIRSIAQSGSDARIETVQRFEALDEPYPAQVAPGIAQPLDKEFRRSQRGQSRLDMIIFP